MKSKLSLAFLLAGGLALNPLAYADEDDTMAVIEEEQTEEEVMEFVEHEAPNPNAEFGTAASNMARNPDAEYQGREFGEWVSSQARQEFAPDIESIREDVQQDIQQDGQRDARADLRDGNADGFRP
jgi:hypothetical protein